MGNKKFMNNFKIISVILFLSSICCLTSCGQNNKNNQNNMMKPIAADEVGAIMNRSIYEYDSDAFTFWNNITDYTSTLDGVYQSTLFKVNENGAFSGEEYQSAILTEEDLSVQLSIIEEVYKKLENLYDNTNQIVDSQASGEVKIYLEQFKNNATKIHDEYEESGTITENSLEAMEKAVKYGIDFYNGSLKQNN